MQNAVIGYAKSACGNICPAGSAICCPVRNSQVFFFAMKKKLFLKQNFMFSKVYKHGRYKTNNVIVVYVLKNYKRREKSKLGISVNAKLGGAVARNRVKRIVRESFYKLYDKLYDGNIIVVMTRKPCYEKGFKMQDMYAVMTKLFKQLGLLKE